MHDLNEGYSKKEWERGIFVKNERGSWASNVGFLLAAIGSAVGLGNIWGFPYKMGKSGGFTFLIVYLLLAVFVGFIVMVSELAMGRKVGQGVIGCYTTLSKRFKWVGWLAVFSPFVVMSFYAVLGGYCIEYMALNLSTLAFPTELATGAELFDSMLTNPFGSILFTLLFLVICYLINRGGISGGIEKFNTVGMPALFIMLVIIICRSLTLPGAMEGLKFMFVPGYAVSAGFIDKAPGFLTVLATAGGQMFFSLSLAMGVMFTYGSYLSKKENLVKNAALIVFSDTLVALMAGLAVIPAAVAISGPSATLSGPKLLFITLQDVFNAMGTAGPLFGVLFYLLVLIAALTSAVSLVEVVTTFFLDRAEEKGKKGNRSKVVLIVCLAILVEASIVAIDGLGAGGLGESLGSGLPVPFKEAAATVLADGTVQYAGWNDCWLDFMDVLSEGIAMPLGALLMSLMVAWEVKPKLVLDEVRIGSSAKIDTFYKICIYIITPLGMLLVLLGQLNDFGILKIFG